MREVVVLADVQRLGVVPAVVPVVADWLHADLLARFDHDVGVRA